MTEVNGDIWTCLHGNWKHIHLAPFAQSLTPCLTKKVKLLQCQGIETNGIQDPCLSTYRLSTSQGAM